MELNKENQIAVESGVDTSAKDNSGIKPANIEIAGSKGGGFVTNIIINLIICVAVVAGGLYYYDKNYAQKVVTYDMVKSIDALKVLYVQGKMDDKQLAQAVQDIKTKIDKSTAKNDIVIVKDVIVSGNIKEISQ